VTLSSYYANFLLSELSKDWSHDKGQQFDLSLQLRFDEAKIMPLINKNGPMAGEDFMEWMKKGLVTDLNAKEFWDNKPIFRTIRMQGNVDHIVAYYP